MAANDVTTVETGNSRLVTLATSGAARNLVLMLGSAAVIAVMIGIWLWSQQPDYRVLFSNYSDKDGGAIVAALQQMNVPYKYAEGGGAILVPANQVHDVRLKLAAQGLPKASGVGFELMENQKLGVSQFLEQVNFQRALEGELARSIQSIDAVQAARVHLALPKASVFVRDQQQATASVLLNLHPGRVLDNQQVSAIVHLVASSVPDLSAKNVTVVDQNGNLLSSPDRYSNANGLDPSQLKYVQTLQKDIARRIESIISPIVGVNNVRAEATADVDFSRIEQAAETYGPNQKPDTAAIRSQQTSESQTLNGNGGTGGVPGALTNQPPPNVTAPITAPNAAPAANAQGAQGAAGAAGAGAAAQGAATSAASPTNVHRDNTVNYEVDKTIRYTQQPMGGLKRLSVAVVVNYRRDVDKAGKPVVRPLTEAEKNQITDLVKDAMGFNKDRGDTVNVVNTPFAGAEKEVLPEPPVWKKPETLQTAKEIGKYVLAALVLGYLFFKVLRPMMTRLSAMLPEPPERLPQTEPAMLDASQLDYEASPRRGGYQENLDYAKKMARADPKVVASVVKGWVSGNE